MGLKSKLIVVLVLLATQFAFGETTATGDDRPQDQDIEVESALPAEQRTSARTGNKFIKDTSIPELGEAIQDPSGLIWGEPAKQPNGELTEMNFADAKKYCRNLAWKTKRNVRLPSVKGFIKLRDFLGNGSTKGYSPLATDGNEVLPNLNHNWYWSSEKFGAFSAYQFNGWDGDISWFSRESFTTPVRCVLR